MKKYFAESIGTFVLVFMGCGTAMLVGCDAAAGSGYILTALAFGLSVVAMAYCVGEVSGGHFNVAVTIGMLIRKKISAKDELMYCLFQLIGAIAASFLLFIIFKGGNIPDMTGTLGSNGLGGVNGNAVTGLIVEIVLTCVLLLVIQGVTSAKFQYQFLSGIIIGLALTLIHIIGIGLTGTSVNPTRSFGPAVVSALTGNPEPLKSLWIFIIGPSAGAVLATMIYPYFEKNE